MAEDWNAQRVTSLAPDARVAAAGLKLAKTGTWSDVGYHESLLWGQCKGSGKNPYQVCADLADSAFRCSCPSRKFPCKHAVGLLHLWCDGAAAPAQPAEFAREWAERRVARAARVAERAALRLFAAVYDDGRRFRPSYRYLLQKKLRSKS